MLVLLCFLFFLVTVLSVVSQQWQQTVNRSLWLIMLIITQTFCSNSSHYLLGSKFKLLLIVSRQTFFCRRDINGLFCKKSTYLPILNALWHVNWALHVYLGLQCRPNSCVLGWRHSLACTGVSHPGTMKMAKDWHTEEDAGAGKGHCRKSK